MSYWNLQFLKVFVKHFMHGKDQQEKQNLFASVINRDSNDLSKVCLQGGVPSSMDKKYGQNLVSIDLYDERPCIDHKMDLENLYHYFGSIYKFDFIVCNAILEHVKNPWKCVDNLKAVMKKGSEIWLEVPFVQVYHPFKSYKEHEHGMLADTNDCSGDNNHGGDYWRFTPQGIVELMKPLKPIKVMMIDQGGVCYYGRKETEIL